VDKIGLDNAPFSVLRVAIDVPLRRVFDYLPLNAAQPTKPGCRVAVRFGRKRAIGIVLEVATDSRLAPDRLKRIESALDDEPVLDPSLLGLLRWASAYYVHPPGEVCSAALPVLIRQGRPAEAVRSALRLTETGSGIDPDALTRAARQAAMMVLLREGPRALDDPALGELGDGWQAVARRLEVKGWIERIDLAEEEPEAAELAAPGPTLMPHQREAVDAILAVLGRYAPILLYGVTGSGKTEVYLSAIEAVLDRGEQALVLVPEIGLTPQLVSRFRRRFNTHVAAVHSGLTASERLNAWRDARRGRARIVIGTRSAVFTPLQRCGLIVVDEEHDPSLKQQEGFRYSARDLAVVRARMQSVPVVLGSATPSLESLRNVEAQRYQQLNLPERPGTAVHPRMRMIDLRVMPARDGLTAPMLSAIQHHVDDGGQVILFLNRRGFAPTLYCASCGWTAICPRCDARLTVHQRPAGLHCHHCGHRSPRLPACPECGGETRDAGQGTERVEEALTRHFPEAPLARLDRDTARRHEDLEALVAGMREGRTRILIGTQMLTKGHDFPNVTLVGVLNADQGLFGTDFRSDERLAQTILQVSGRAGRRDRPGEVLLQTGFPDHPLLTRLVKGGYEAFARQALAERAEARWPPYSHLVLLRAEAHSQPLPIAFLEAARDLALERLPPVVRVLGPAPSPMERRQGRFRAQLLLQSDDRAELHSALAGLVEAVAALPDARKLRWSLDVDPAELF